MPPRTAAPDTLPANFSGWDQAPDTLPANFSGFDDVKPNSAQPQPLPSLWQRIKQALAPRPVEHSAGPYPMPGSFEGHPENIGEYIPASAGEIAGGVKDIAQGNTARGGHRIIQGAGNATLPVLPFVPPAAVANPGTLLRVLGGAAAGQFVGQKGAAVVGATPEQQEFAGDIGGLVGGYGAAKLPGTILRRFNPAALKTSAGESFNVARAAAGPQSVNPEQAGQAVLEAQELQDVGRRMPRTMTKFIQRVTAPDAPPLTYDEARQFYSAAGDISANERNGLSRQMQRALNQFRRDLGAAIQQTANDAGVGIEHEGHE